MKGTIYILINEAMPGYIKIGKTTNSIEQRMKELYKTSVPLPFECFYACLVEDMDKVERRLHDAFADNRVSSNREFFEIAPERVFAVLELMSIEDKTPKENYIESKEDEKALDKAKKRREVFNFNMVDIPVGSTLTFSGDESIICKVIDNRNVEFEGEVLSLTESARRSLESMNRYSKSIAGTGYWMFEREILSERRKRMEEEV